MRSFMTTSFGETSCWGLPVFGDLAQLVERLHGMQKVAGSNPVTPTLEGIRMVVWSDLSRFSSSPWICSQRREASSETGSLSMRRFHETDQKRSGMDVYSIWREANQSSSSDVS